jgi:hypothetical protein
MRFQATISCSARDFEETYSYSAIDFEAIDFEAMDFEAID